jgi:type IV pilus assembly protein PilB
MDIVERRRPQDGQFETKIDGAGVDVRVATGATIWGETAVLRLLDKSRSMKHLSELGMPPDTHKRYLSIVNKPYGMIVCSGPTGSGKTTTLYATLAEITRSELNVMTIEDPVEYVFPEVNQMQINPQADVTFASGLKSILRQDPDVILVGEIRDEETAAIAVQSALTGHLVFTTVHANNVVDVIGRFLNMNVHLYNFVSALNCVLAQRLVRRICVHCKRPAAASDRLLDDSGLEPDRYRDFVFYEGAGCMDCNGTGYRGRIAIAELLNLSDNIRQLIIDRRSAAEIKRAAKAEGMRFLRESALQKVFAGETTLHDINKVTFVE